MNILKYPDPILLTRAEMVTDFDEQQEIVIKLRLAIAGVQWGQALGMAAPQIGISKRVFIASGKVYINPTITFRSPEQIELKEGCYSLDNNRFDYITKRSVGINMVWQDEITHGLHDRYFDGDEAIVIQHEYDHLEGVLCNQQRKEVT